MAGTTYQYIEGYRSSCKYHSDGNVNIILSAPHGGALMPDDVPDRTNIAYQHLLHNDHRFHDDEHAKIVVVKDSRTDEFTENVANELKRTWNLKPFIIIGRWNRKKIDFNREVLEATLNNSEAMSAYHNYRINLNDAIDQIQRLFGNGLLVDVHGHGHGNYSMIGYLLTSDQLNRNNLSYPSCRTSIESLCGSNRDAAIRGPTSFGTIFERHGLGTVYPSLAHPTPESRPYFSGGHTVRHYCSKINAIQIELSPDIRTGSNRHIHARNFAHVLIEYMKMNNLLKSK